jgi:phosphoglycolate phosphatase-like HAD superfamily hydrolase
MPELAGRTEPVIFREALKVSGVDPSEDVYDQFAAEQARGYIAHPDELRAFDLDHYLDFDIGAYGTDDDTRANLVNIARQRAEKTHGANFGDGATILIGDTPNDVAAARASGARIVAVATGKDTPADLATAGADTVLPDLTDTPAILAAVYGKTG